MHHDGFTGWSRVQVTVSRHQYADRDGAVVLSGCCPGTEAISRGRTTARAPFPALANACPEDVGRVLARRLAPSSTTVETFMVTRGDLAACSGMRQGTWALREARNLQETVTDEWRGTLKAAHFVSVALLEVDAVTL
jgi:hypothetical protein